MSRITVSRDPEIVIGWDRPLQRFFADRYASDGELVAGIGLLGPDGPAKSSGHVYAWLLEQGVPDERAIQATSVLSRHQQEDAGNVILNLAERDSSSA